MTKKSLANLLREEAQQPPEPETEAIQEVAPQPLELGTALSETKPLDETTVEPSANTSTTLRAKRTSSTKAELEITMSELRKSLQAAHRKENSLQQQITDLQSDLQEQKVLIQRLQADLEPTNKIKAELEQAKKVILQLSQANSKTTQEVNTPKKESKGSRSQNLALQKLPQQSIQPDPISNETFEQNVGWFD